MYVESGVGGTKLWVIYRGAFLLHQFQELKTCWLIPSSLYGEFLSPEYLPPELKSLELNVFNAACTATNNAEFCAMWMIEVNGF